MAGWKSQKNESWRFAGNFFSNWMVDFFKIATSLNTFDETAGFSCHLRSLEIASSGNIYVTTLNEPQQLLFCTPWSSIKPCLSHHFIPLNHGSLGITTKFHYSTILPWLSNEFSHQKSHHRDDGSRINHLHLPMERVATINGKLFNGHSRNPNWRNLPYIYIYIYYIYIRATPGFCPGVAAYVCPIHEQMMLQITVIPMGKITQVLETIKQTKSKHPKFLWEKQKRHNTCNSCGKNNKGTSKF